MILESSLVVLSRKGVFTFTDFKGNVLSQTRVTCPDQQEIYALHVTKDQKNILISVWDWNLRSPIIQVYEHSLNGEGLIMVD